MGWQFDLAGHDKRLAQAQRHAGHVRWNSQDCSWAVACAEPPGVTQGAVNSKLRDGSQCL